MWRIHRTSAALRKATCMYLYFGVAACRVWIRLWAGTVSSSYGYLLDSAVTHERIACCNLIFEF